MKADVVTPTIFLIGILILAPLFICALNEANENMWRQHHDRERAATQEGSDAFVVGLPANENPYDKGSGLHALWLSGYRKAMEAKK